MPHGVVAVAHDHPNNGVHEDVFVAIRNAFRAARRELEAYVLSHGVPAPVEASPLRASRRRASPSPSPAPSERDPKARRSDASVKIGAVMAYVYKRISASDLPTLKALLAVFGEAFGEPDTYQGAVPSDAYLETLLGKPHFIALAALDGDGVVGGLAAYQLENSSKPGARSTSTTWRCGRSSPKGGGDRAHPRARADRQGARHVRHVRAGGSRRCSRHSPLRITRHARGRVPLRHPARRVAAAGSSFRCGRRRARRALHAGDDECLDGGVGDQGRRRRAPCLVRQTVCAWSTLQSSRSNSSLANNGA